MLTHSKLIGSWNVDLKCFVICEAKKSIWNEIYLTWAIIGSRRWDIYWGMNGGEKNHQP